MINDLETLGFSIIENVYTEVEIRDILRLVESQNLSGQFGVREFLLRHSVLQNIVFNKNLKHIISRIAPTCNKSIKSIYFGKPPTSNWIINWHQDLTINLANRAEIVGYKNWRELPDRVVVQPNRELLENIFTIRIHLDDCTEKNGALRIIDKSHLKGIIRINEWNREEKETICEVPCGGVLLMKPLLIHSSRRTENDLNRRVIHMEFTDQNLPSGLEWKEMIEI